MYRGRCCEMYRNVIFGLSNALDRISCMTPRALDKAGVEPRTLLPTYSALWFYRICCLACLFVPTTVTQY